MPPRFHVEQPLRAGSGFELPAGPTRHVQVLRLQPGAPITLFDGSGGEWRAVIRRIGRRDVEVEVVDQLDADRELAAPVLIAVGMPANDRMDALVEKATELGAAAIQPLVCERSVLRPAGERADKKVAHWRGIAVAASEQSGRTRVPVVAAVRRLADWLAELPSALPQQQRLVLSLRRDATAFAQVPAGAAGPLLLLSGPEGGFSDAEEQAAVAAGFRAVSLGPRVLRADTAPLAALAAWSALVSLAVAGRPPSESIRSTND